MTSEEILVDRSHPDEEARAQRSTTPPAMPPKRKEVKPAMDKIAKITVWIPDQKALNQISSVAKVVTECGSPKRDNDGNFVVTLYGTPAEAQKIAALSYRHEIDENYGDELKAAQQQVSKTDRFQGGKVKPEGLGVKR
jgi:hypothetical protein